MSERAIFLTINLHNVMKKIKVRRDLMSKKDYSVKYGVNRVKIDQMINEGLLFVEEISGVHYIKI